VTGLISQIVYLHDMAVGGSLAA